MISRLIGKKISLLILLVLFFCVTKESSAQPIRLDSLPFPLIDIDTVNPVKELRKDIDGLLSNPDFSNANIGVIIQSLETGEILYAKNENKNFIPASTQKILTSAAALKYLGSDFTYTTEMYLSGELLKNGEFLGDIIIRGSGDPTLSRYFHEKPLDIIDDWVRKLDSIGIRSIRGNIIGDDNFFDDIYYAPGWAWDDMIYPYSAQVNALSILDNNVDITVRPGDSIGYISKIRVNPDCNYVRILNNVFTGEINEPTSIDAARELTTNIIEINGTIAYDTSGKTSQELLPVTIDNPTKYFLAIFRNFLEDHKIRFRGAVFDIDEWNDNVNYTEMESVGSYTSPPMKEIISVINKKSHNLCAEILLKTIAREIKGEGSFENGTKLLKRFASEKGINPEKISIVDGSGLSRNNLITPAYQAALLSGVYRSEHFETFLSSLAVPGKEGTLERRMTKSLAEKSVKAKTGTMNNISNICGYLTTRDGELLAFSIMLNNFTTPHSLARNLQDLICMRAASFTRK